MMSSMNEGNEKQRKNGNQYIQVYVRQRPLNSRERNIRSLEVVDVISPKEIVTRHSIDSKITKKFTFDRVFGANSRQVEVYSVVVAPLIDEVIAGYNCTVFAYGQTGTGKTHTMVGTACPDLTSSWDDDTDVGIIPRALSHLFDELRLMEVDFSMRISYLELYNEELCDLLSTDDSVRVRIFDDSTKKGSVIIHGLEEIPVHSKDDVYKLLEKGQERRKTATTLMNAQSSRSHTVFSILVHIRETGTDGEELLKIGKLNLVDLAGSENATKAGTEKGIRVREAVNINQSLLTLGRVITALVERTPHIPYRESKLTRLLQESLGGRTKTSIIATISPGHKDIEETLSTLQYADRAKSIQNKPEVNQRLTKVVMLKEYSEEIEKLKRDLVAARDKNGIYLSEENFTEINNKMDAQQRELNEKVLLIKAMKDEMQNKERLFIDLSENLVQKTNELQKTENTLLETKTELMQKKQILNKTKKGYIEKKKLLENHVRTEKELTKQASEILSVANVATNDTQQLHHTIERRKNVDRQIERTCDQFSDQMKDHCEILENNLKTLQDQHATKINLIDQELSNNVKRQNEFNTNVGVQVDQVLQVLEETNKKRIDLEETATKLLKDISDEHKKTFIDLFAKQKGIFMEQNQQIKPILVRLIDTTNENSIRNGKLLETMENAVQTLSKGMNEFSNAYQTQFKNNMALFQTYLEETNMMKQSIEQEYALLTEEKSIFEDFMQKMNTLQETRLANANIKSKLAAQFQTQFLDTQQNLTTHASEASAFFEKQIAAKKAYREEMKAQLSQSQSLNEAFKADCVALQHDNEKFLQANAQYVDKLTKKQHENYAQIESLLGNQRSNADRLCCERSKVHKTSLETVKLNVGDHVHKANNELFRVRSFVADLQASTDQYAAKHKEQVNSCAADVDTFRKVELKTYAPTGTTPSKRDFVYPRVLVATSPHDKILKRLRQDNDWSDLDVTATIDEEELDSLMPQNSLLDSLRETSNLALARNSTPSNKKSLSLSNSNKENFSDSL